MSSAPNTPSASEEQNNIAPDSKQAQALKSRRLLTDFLAPLRVRDFRLLFGGQMISTLGDLFYAIALPWLMLSSGRTPQELGIVLAAYGVPRVGALLLGGILSDHLRPRRVMLLSDIARALLVGILVGLVISDHTEVWQLCAIAIPLGAFTGLFLPAYYAMLPEVLNDDELQAGNALNSASIQFALLVGSGAAGIVVSRLQSGFAFTVDALTFVVSAATLFLMHGGQNAAPTLTSNNAIQESTTSKETQEESAYFPPNITFGQLLRTWRLLQVALLVVIFGNFLFNGLIEVALPTLARNQFAAGASGYGLLMAAFGGGSLLGGLIAGLMGRVRHRGKLMLALIMALACWYTFIPFVGLIGATLLMGIAGVTNGILTVLAFTLLQQQAPRPLLGRLMGVLMVATLGLYPFSVALAGVISTHLGPAILFPISGTMMLAAALFGWLQREIRKL